MKLKIKTGNRRLNSKFAKLKKFQKVRVTVESLKYGDKSKEVAKKINRFTASNKAQQRSEFLKTRTASATVAAQISRIVKNGTKNLTDKEWEKLNKLHRDYAIAQANRIKDPIMRKQVLQQARERYAEMNQRRKDINKGQRGYDRIKRKEQKGIKLSPAEVGAEKPRSRTEALQSIGRNVWKRASSDQLMQMLKDRHYAEWKAMLAQRDENGNRIYTEDEVYEHFKQEDKGKDFFDYGSNGRLMYKDTDDNWYVIYNE